MPPYHMHFDVFLNKTHVLYRILICEQKHVNNSNRKHFRKVLAANLCLVFSCVYSRGPICDDDVPQQVFFL